MKQDASYLGDDFAGWSTAIPGVPDDLIEPSLWEKSGYQDVQDSDTKEPKSLVNAVWTAVCKLDLDRPYSDYPVSSRGSQTISFW